MCAMHLLCELRADASVARIATVVVTSLQRPRYVVVVAEPARTCQARGQGRCDSKRNDRSGQQERAAHLCYIIAVHAPVRVGRRVEARAVAVTGKKAGATLLHLHAILGSVLLHDV